MSVSPAARPEFRLVDGRVVHLRIAGAGPPVVLMHDSPRSSLMLQPLIEGLRDDFTVVALDTPGFGESEPLPQGAPTIEDLAAALHATLDALGLDRFALYGSHTSAKIALDFATRWPGRVGGMVLDGLSLAAPAAQRALLEGSYLKGFKPADDGAHLVGLWLKMRDQFRFFPWHDRSLRTRLDWPMPSPEVLQRYLMDLLFAGPDFGRTYGAALRHDPAPLLPRLAVPTDIVCRVDDVLQVYLDRLPRLPDGCRVERLPADDARWRHEVCARLGQHAQPLPAARIRPATVEDATHRGYVEAGGGRLHVRALGARGQPPVLLLPQVPGVGTTLLDLAWALGARHRVWLPDLPGCGDSSPPEVATADGAVDALVAVLADGARQLLDAAGEASLSLFAPAEAAALALRLAAALGPRVRQVVLDGWWAPSVVEARRWREALPVLAPSAAGAHLLDAWHFLRDAEFAFPWYDGRIAAIRRIAPHLDPVQRHTVLVDLFKQPGAWHAAMGALATAAADGMAAAPHGPSVALLHLDDDPGYRAPRGLPAHWQRVERPRERSAAWARVCALLSEPGR